MWAGCARRAQPSRSMPMHWRRGGKSARPHDARRGPVVLRDGRLGGRARRTGGIDIAATSNESEFVATVLAALIMKGEVANNKRQLFEATNMLRGLLGATFGGQHSNGGPA